MTRLRTASDGKELEVAAFTRALQSESRARVGEPRGARNVSPRLRRGGGKAVRSGTAHRRGRAASRCRGPQQARRALAATFDFEAAASGWHDRGRLSLSPRSSRHKRLVRRWRGSAWRSPGLSQHLCKRAFCTPTGQPRIRRDPGFGGRSHSAARSGSSAPSQWRHLNHADHRGPALAARLHSRRPALEAAAERTCALPRKRAHDRRLEGAEPRRRSRLATCARNTIAAADAPHRKMAASPLKRSRAADEPRCCNRRGAATLGRFATPDETCLRCRTGDSSPALRPCSARKAGRLGRSQSMFEIHRHLGRPLPLTDRRTDDNDASATVRPARKTPTSTPPCKADRHPTATEPRQKGSASRTCPSINPAAPTSSSVDSRRTVTRLCSRWSPTISRPPISSAFRRCPRRSSDSRARSQATLRPGRRT